MSQSLYWKRSRRMSFRQHSVLSMTWCGPWFRYRCRRIWCVFSDPYLCETVFQGSFISLSFLDWLIRKKSLYLRHFDIFLPEVRLLFLDYVLSVVCHKQVFFWLWSHVVLLFLRMIFRILSMSFFDSNHIAQMPFVVLAICTQCSLLSRSAKYSEKYAISSYQKVVRMTNISSDTSSVMPAANCTFAASAVWSRYKKKELGRLGVLPLMKSGF